MTSATRPNGHPPSLIWGSGKKTPQSVRSSLSWDGMGFLGLRTLRGPRARESWGASAFRDEGEEGQPEL